MDNITSAPKRLRECLSNTLFDGHNTLSENTSNTPRRTSFDSPFKFIQIIDKKFEQQNENLKRLISESESRLSAQINERMDALSKEFDNIKERVNKLETVTCEIETMKTEMQLLKSQIKSQQNSIVASDLRINNIPYVSNENLYEIFQDICNTIDTPVPSINSIYRLKNSNNKLKQNSLDAVIIVKLMSPYDKNFFMKTLSDFRKRNKNFSFTLRDIGIDSASKFYVNENLTYTNYKILQSAVKLKKQNLLQAAFTLRGLVYVKISTDDKPICIWEENDLDKFFRVSPNEMEASISGH